MFTWLSVVLVLENSGVPVFSQTLEPTVTILSWSADQFRVRLSGQPGQGYRVEASSDLKDWAVLVASNSPSGTFEFVDADANLFTRRFYRAVAVDLSSTTITPLA